MTMVSLIHWFANDGNAISVLVTIGIAVLLVCCLECSDCPSRDKDDIFRRHAI
jgi:predicted DNA-binding helix-hairpin-helix protein